MEKNQNCKKRRASYQENIIYRNITAHICSFYNVENFQHFWLACCSGVSWRSLRPEVTTAGEFDFDRTFLLMFAE